MKEQILSKNIQIPEELFARLCGYHLFDKQDAEQTAKIREGLEAKLDAMQRRNDHKDRLLTTKKQER